MPRYRKVSSRGQIPHVARRSPGYEHEARVYNWVYKIGTNKKCLSMSAVFNTRTSFGLYWERMKGNYRLRDNFSKTWYKHPEAGCSVIKSITRRLPPGPPNCRPGEGSLNHTLAFNIVLTMYKYKILMFFFHCLNCSFIIRLFLFFHLYISQAQMYSTCLAHTVVLINQTMM